MISVAELMTDPDFTRTVVLRRPRQGTLENEGEYSVPYGESEITAIVQPATTAEVQMLPEGNRIGEVISVWSGEELRATDGKLREPDVLVVDGVHYRVTHLEPWPEAGYFRAFAGRFVP